MSEQQRDSLAMSARETRLVAAAQAFIAVTRGGILEQNAHWTDLRDALAAYPLRVVKHREAP